MVPKVEGAWDIHYVDRLLAQLEAQARAASEPILVHAILETALGVTNLEEIATASPRMQGMSFGPADLAASRRMKTTRVGGGHPGYRVLADPDAGDPEAPRATAQQDLWHYSIARMVDACTATGILPFYGPFGDITDVAGCEAQFRAAFLMGCVGAWSLHPRQIEIAKKVFSPDPEEVHFAKKVIEAIPDGRGVHMIDGKMQDDATWKQCKVMVGLAEMLAEKDPELREAYGCSRFPSEPAPILVRMEAGARRHQRGRRVDRIVAFSDGVFTIAVTLLMLTCRYHNDLRADEINDYLFDHSGQVFAYFLSFYDGTVLGSATTPASTSSTGQDHQLLTLNLCSWRSSA